MAPSLAELYRAAMIPHRFGYALYEPVAFISLRPGMLGYLDEYRRWHSILDLADAEAITAAGYTPIGRLQRCDPDPRRWGPRVSSNTNEANVELGGAINAQSLGLPVGIAGAVRYSTNADFGAVLMCDDDVISEGYDFRNPFLDWLKENSKKLLADYPDLKRHGVCATTWTYSASDIHINAWTNSNTNLTVGFVVDAEPVARGHSEMSWVRSRSSSGWMAWTGQKRVVFFTGVKIKYGTFHVREKAESSWRGAKDAFLVTGLDGGESCEAIAEFFGDDWEEIKEDEEEQDD